MITARRAYAKVNLALSVGSPLPAGGPAAGMHPIASWMHAIDLYDEVEVRPLDRGESRLEVGWAPDAPRPSPIDWPPEKDLALRGLRAIEAHVARPLPALLRVTKRTPVGGGLGGGSSDAAAAMLAANEAFGLGLPIATLATLSRSLGSDIAYFLDEGDGPPRPAVVARLGDRIERMPVAPGHLVLIFPEFGCPTGVVYQVYDRLGPRSLREAEVRMMAAGGRVDAGRLFNDLTAPAEAVRPALAAIRERTATACGLPVHLTGSGSTLFVLCEGGEEGRVGEVSGKIRARVPDVGVVGTRLV